MLTAKEILHSLPERFIPEKAKDTRAIVHFDLHGDEGGQYTVEISDGSCSIEEGHRGEAACTVKAKAEHYAALETGELKAQNAILTRKVIISNLMLMMQFMQMFERVPRG